MRKDILESITEHFMTGIKSNFADIARRYNCDYRTVKRYYDLGNTVLPLNFYLYYLT